MSCHGVCKVLCLRWRNQQATQNLAFLLGPISFSLLIFTTITSHRRDCDVKTFLQTFKRRFWYELRRSGPAPPLRSYSGSTESNDAQNWRYTANMFMWQVIVSIPVRALRETFGPLKAVQRFLILYFFYAEVRKSCMHACLINYGVIVLEHVVKQMQNKQFYIWLHK